MARGWVGDRVRLVPLDRDKHLENALKWLNDPLVTALMEVGDWPLTRGQEISFFDDADDPSGSEVRFAVETLGGEHIGFSGLRQISWRDRFAVTGSLIGRRDLWGQGFGTDAARIRSRYAFEVLGLRLLQAEVMADNSASLAMLAKLGYREVGRIPRRYWKRGAFRDQVILVLLNDG